MSTAEASGDHPTPGSLKRRRLSCEDTSHSRRYMAHPVNAAEAAPVTRSSIWFDDGSVVLQAESVQFKVHRTLLARHSVIFKDTFGVPHPTDSEPTVDGCPLLHLMDSAEDIKHMLLALYDKCYNPREAIEFNVLAAMIRMGRKYEIDYLRDEALVRLTMEFPTTLAEWDKLPHYYTQIVHQNGILFDIINLAQQSDIKSILPAAYYLCIQELDDLLLGSKREDGSMAIVSDEVRRDCVLGREKLLRAQAEQPFKWVEFMGAIDQCSQPSRCLDAAHKITKALWVPMPEPARTLEKWNEFAQIVPAEVKALCPQCVAAARLSHEEGRRYLWEHLPAYFGLPGWDELKNFDA
ncbi:hypothetical protein NMY22_g1152 [Coprinellus aureogranulatus]|nr:hypothetical protein NMY22_g1152 [Coprinellus aureogranulatus]